MFLLEIRVLTVVCWIMCVRITVSQASAPAPKLKFALLENASITLNTLLYVSCDAPSGAQYPVTVFIGKLENSLQTPETTEALMNYLVFRYPTSARFTISAIAKNEGKIVCWYKSTQTVKNSYSQFSNPFTLVISALPHPKVVLQPNIFVVGGNYTVYCNSDAGPVTNFTLSLYYRILPVTPGTNWTFAGSVFLTNSTGILLQQTNVVIPVEFACTMEMLWNNGKVLHSPQSNIEQAIPEELPVRLWEEHRGESCLGYLDVKFKGNWNPVCQKEVDTVADASAANATANVVCRELGCGHVLEWTRTLKNNRHFSQTIGGIRCSGKEEKARDCPINEIETCRNNGLLYIICSDAMGPPKLSVITYGPVSKLYVTEKQDVEISCSIDSTYLKTSDDGYMVFRKDGASLRHVSYRPGSPVSIRQSAKVLEGEYDCVFQLYSSKIRRESQPSNSVFIYIYNPPNPVPIVAGVLTTVVGVAILTYTCVCRTKKEEVQANEFPAHSQDPATNTENPDNNVYIPQQL